MFNSLISRVILLNFLLLVIGVGGFTRYHFTREQASLIDSTRLNARMLLDTIERSIFTSMDTGNSVEVQTILESVGNSDYLSSVRIFSPTGIILKSNRPEEINQKVDLDSLNLFSQQQTQGVFRTENGAEVLAMVRPINAKKRCYRCHPSAPKVIGVLNLNFSLDDMYRQLHETSQVFFVSTLLMLAVLSGGIWMILARLLRRPLRQIFAGMAQVEAGNLDIQLAGQDNDEIGRLVQGFNSMVARLNQTQQELQQYHFRQMEHADRLASCGEMATGLAHEIKNPLAGIRGAIEVLTDDFPPEDPRREVMNQIQLQVNRMNKTITDLLYFGRPGKPEFSYADINSLLRQTLRFVEQHPEAKKVSQVEILASGLPPVWIDQKQIQQVILNIILNALQAMANGGELTVRTALVSHPGKDWVQVDIRDTGPGISPEELGKIFTPFYTTKTQGTGLGLPICQQLLENNGGSLRVDSQLGEGASFILEFPIISLPDQNNET